MTTDLPLPGRREGKVRDVYEVEAPDGSGPRVPALLIVATDRISAFDVVMPNGVPGKGRLLTDISLRWFDWIEHRALARTHVMTSDIDRVAGIGEDERESLRGRIIVGRRCRIVPVECVVRGYIEGSGWKEYRRTGSICGVELPPGLRQGDELPEPIFTPATKEQEGRHDENIDFERACEIAGEDVMRRLRETSLSIYRAARDYARERGIILADTKFEFGFPVDDEGDVVSDEPLLADEALTPDSSRFWPLESWDPGHEQASFDKQFVREYLEQLVVAGQWDRTAPGPELPEEVIAGTLERYEEARRRLFDV